jgi:hypothetical protein
MVCSSFKIIGMSASPFTTGLSVPLNAKIFCLHHVATIRDFFNSRKIILLVGDY